MEGALDALAVTSGRYVGVAPLGTALTDDHVAALQTAVPNSGVVVATDNDPPAGKPPNGHIGSSPATTSTPTTPHFPPVTTPPTSLGVMESGR